jgi:hypothetical protein
MSVAEPWDFESSAGENELSGVVQGVVADTVGTRCLLVHTAQEIEVRGERYGRELFLSPRHRGRAVEDLLRGEPLSVNGALAHTGLCSSETSF